MQKSDELINYYVGYDQTEAEAYEVCRFSFLRHSSLPVHLVKLDQKSLRWSGLYRRAPEENSRIDCFDGKPFSTQFTFTRFLVPHLMQFQGWALFSDCDFLWLSNPAALWDLRDDRYAVQVVKHDHRPKDRVKMEGQAQTTYPRKNWSSLILWNCSHAAHKRLTVDQVNLEPGSWLHGFGWLDDSEIGALPARWNWLEGSENDDSEHCALHFTRGGPWFEQCQDVQFADLWRAENRLRCGV